MGARQTGGEVLAKSKSAHGSAYAGGGEQFTVGGGDLRVGAPADAAGIARSYSMSVLARKRNSDRSIIFEDEEENETSRVMNDPFQ